MFVRLLTCLCKKVGVVVLCLWVCLFVVLVLWKVRHSSFLSLRLLVDRPYAMLCPLRQGSHEDCSVKHMGIATAVQWIPGHLVQPTCVTCGISLASQASEPLYSIVHMSMFLRTEAKPKQSKAR